MIAFLALVACKSRGTYDFAVQVPDPSVTTRCTGGAVTGYQMIIVPGSCVPNPMATVPPTFCPAEATCPETSSICVKACDSASCPVSDLSTPHALPTLPAGDYAVEVDLFSPIAKVGSICQQIHIDADGTHGEVVDFDFTNTSDTCCSCCKPSG